MAGRLDETQLLHVTEPAEWRAWLAEHHASAREIWLVYYKKHTGRPRIAYNDAVEEALCFGWIDSTVRSVDEDRTAQRFSPRRPGSPYSQANKERLRALIREGKVIDTVRATLGDLEQEQFEIAPDILEAIKASGQAWEHFQRFSEPYVRIRIAFIESARRRPQEFEKRLRHFIAMTEKNRQFGFGGIEKHF